VILILVTAGLDPAVHADETQTNPHGKSQKRQLCMDCRVKPDNDEARAIPFSRRVFCSRPSYAKPLHESCPK
jgi:hypothetical protein